jgi:hypothetical protein
VWDKSLDGLATAHEIGIWTTGGTLLASTTVPAGTSGTLVGEYRFISLTTPLYLAAGASYRIGALTGTTEIWHGSTVLPNGPTFAVPNVNYVDRYANMSGVFTFPTDLADPSTSAWDFPNFQFDVVPEPATGALVMFGLTLAGWRRRSTR